ELLLVVVIKFLRDRHGLLLYFHVFACINEFPIRVNRVCDGRNGLLRECQISNLAIVLRDADVARVHGSAESIQQLLRETDKNRGLYGRIKQVRKRSRGTPRVIPYSEKVCA